MATNAMTRWLTSRFKRVHNSRRSFQGLEPLPDRMLPAVTAIFSAAAGQLRITGDDLDNTIVVSRNAAGALFVNKGDVVIQGDAAPTIVNTHSIMITGAGGNDILAVDETNGVMPAASIFGGDGNDFLIGGSGADFADGGAGNDIVFLGAGDDIFKWNPGNGSDTVEGGTGRDLMVFNGSDASEQITISGNGSRVSLVRDVGGVTMDLNSLEGIELNPLGGADTITVNVSPTDLTKIRLNLDGSNGGDGRSDAVIINGTNDNDNIRVTAFGNIIVVDGMFPFVDITGAEPANDRLTVNSLDGNDTLDASNLPGNRIGLTLNGGAGNNVVRSQLFGDFNGDGKVDAADFGAFRNALNRSSGIFDFNGDGKVDALDFGEFRLRFGTSV